MEFAYYSIDTKETGENLKKMLKQKHITVDMVRQFLGFESPQAVYKWLSGKSLPTLDHIYALSKFMEVSIDEILINSPCTTTVNLNHKFKDIQKVS